MKISSLLSHVGYVRLLGDPGTELTGITCDSREVKPGDLFVCLNGFHRDGHEFAWEALTRGAAALALETNSPVTETLIEKHRSGQITAPLLVFENTRKVFSLLAAAFYGYPLRSMVSVAVTGTKGKTTTAFMLWEILKKAGYAAGMIGTNGAFFKEHKWELSHTTPEAHELQRLLACMRELGCTHVVMEVSSQAVRTERTAGLFFTCGIFTNLSPDHIGPGEHENFRDYVHQKSRLFSQCGIGIINREDPYAGEIRTHVAGPVVEYGMESGEYRAVKPEHYKTADMLGCEYRLLKKGKELGSVFLPLPGIYNIQNSLAAIAAAGALGINPMTAAGALRNVHVPGRMELVPGISHLWLIVDYAHNEASMESLLSTLRSYEPRRLICVFGCGGNRSKLRRFGMGRAAGTWADLSILTSDNSREEPLSEILSEVEAGFSGTAGRYEVIADRREAIGYAVRHGKCGDIIAVIGKGHETYQETKGVRIHFSDREELERAVNLYR